MELRPYQLEDVEVLLRNKTYGIFNEQRTGKTPTTIIAAAKQADKIVVVCPSSMVTVWADSIATWSDHIPCMYIGTQQQKENVIEEYKQSDKAFLIVSYSLFRSTKTTDGLVKTLKQLKPQALIVDEAHRAVNRNTCNNKSLKKLKYIPIRYYLTGTPAPNHPSQVWAILNLINPAEFSSYWRFVDQFFTTAQIRTPRGVIHNPDKFVPGGEQQLATVLAQHSMMRKRKDVMPWLPKQAAPTRIRISPSKQQLKVLNNLDQYFRYEHLIAESVLTRLILYRQIANDPHIKRLKIGSPKTDWVRRYISDYPNKNIIFFSRFTSYLRLLHEKFGGGLYIGATPVNKRAELVKSFQSTQGNLLFIQIASGKEGLTLDNADTLVFLDIFPPVADNQQARDRIVATSTDKVREVEVYELCLKDTYDERLYHHVYKSATMTDVVNDYKQYIRKE